MDKCPMHSTITYVLSSIAWFNHSKHSKSALLPGSRGLRACHFVPLTSSLAVANNFCPNVYFWVSYISYGYATSIPNKKMDIFFMILHCVNKTSGNYFLKFSFENLLLVEREIFGSRRPPQHSPWACSPGSSTLRL